MQKGDSNTLANIKQEKDDDAMSGVSELNYTPKPSKRLSTIDAMADSFTSPSAKQQKRTPVYSKSPSKAAVSVKLKVHQSLDYSTLSPNAQPSTVEPPNFEALRKEVPVKHDQIEKANEFLHLQQAAKHATVVHNTLKEMGLDMVDEDDNLPNSFFRIFTQSDLDLCLLQPEEQMAHLH